MVSVQGRATMDEGKGEPGPDKNGKARRAPVSIRAFDQCANFQPSSHHCRYSRSFLYSATLRMRRRDKKARAGAKIEIPRSASHPFIIAEVASPQWHSPQQQPTKTSDRQKPRREGSSKTNFTSRRRHQAVMFCISRSRSSRGPSDLCLPRLAIHLCDSSIPSALRRRLRRYVMAAYSTVLMHK